MNAFQGNEIATTGSIGSPSVFASEVVRFAGPAGPRTLVYVALGTVLEGVGLIMLVPLLAGIRLRLQPGAAQP